MGTSVLAGRCKKGSKGSLHLCLHGAAVCPAGRCISGMERAMQSSPAAQLSSAELPRIRWGLAFHFRLWGLNHFLKC